MKQAERSKPRATGRSAANDLAAVRRRSNEFYRRFNNEQFEKCLALVDPRLVDEGAVVASIYLEELRAFRAAYGDIKPIMRKTEVHPPARRQKDKRPFAYTYVVWHDKRGAFHIEQERWIKDNGRWYTRVAGLIPARTQDD